jgi:hypothetical protein
MLKILLLLKKILIVCKVVNNHNQLHNNKIKNNLQLNKLLILMLLMLKLNKLKVLKSRIKMRNFDLYFIIQLLYSYIMEKYHGVMQLFELIKNLLFHQYINIINC